MDYYLNEFDYDVVEVLQKNVDGLSFQKLVSLLGKNSLDVYSALHKLREWNHMSVFNKGYAYYQITKNNEPVDIFLVSCPMCKSRRRLHHKNQFRTTCKNPDCRTPSGKERTFEIINRDWYKKGIIKPINRV